MELIENITSNLKDLNEYITRIQKAYNKEIRKPDIYSNYSLEFISEQVHNAWWDEKKRQGFHAPNDCKSKNHLSFQNADWKAQERLEDLHNPKFHKWCDNCHTDMYPYAELPENIKEYDRVMVRSVLNAIRKMEE